MKPEESQKKKTNGITYNKPVPFVLQTQICQYELNFGCGVERKRKQ